VPNSIRSGERTPKPVPEGLDYDLWLGPAPWRPYAGCPDNGGNWFHVYDYAIGFIAGWGAHPLDLLVWAYDVHRAGPWESEAKGVIPETGCNNVVIDWDARIQLANGVTISYWANGVPRPDESPQLADWGNYAQLIGEDGWVAIRYEGMLCEPQSLANEPIGPDEIHLPLSAGQETNFIECVKSRGTPVSHIDDAVRSDSISHLCDIAIREGRKITWDPLKEELLGDPEASRRMHRAARAPWQV